MALTKEQVKKAMSCKTADELLEWAKSEGVELTREQAEEYIAKMKAVEIPEEYLENIAGGISAACKYRNPDCQDQAYPYGPCGEVFPGQCNWVCQNHA